MERVHGLRCAVPSLGVVARDLLVGRGRKAGDCVGILGATKVPKLPWGELPIQVVGDSEEVVGPNVARAADVAGADLDGIRVDEEE